MKTEELNTNVIYYLQDGYGAEDIALKLGLRPSTVRISILRLRAAGVLDMMWPKDEVTI